MSEKEKSKTPIIIAIVVIIAVIGVVVMMTRDQGPAPQPGPGPDQPGPDQPGEATEGEPGEAEMTREERYQKEFSSKKNPYAFVAAANDAKIMERAKELFSQFEDRGILDFGKVSSKVTYFDVTNDEDKQKFLDAGGQMQDGKPFLAVAFARAGKNGEPITEEDGEPVTFFWFYEFSDFSFENLAIRVSDHVDKDYTPFILLNFHDDDTPLNEAIEDGDVEEAAELIEQGADVTQRDQEHDTPLHEAAGFNDLEMVKLLMKHGAEVNAQNMYGNTPIMEAAYEGAFDTFKYLAKNGGDPSLDDEKKKTILHWAAITRKISAEGVEGKHNIMKYAIENMDIDINSKDEEGKTPLHWAASEGNITGSETLVANGAEVNAKDSFGKIPLHYAVESEEKQEYMKTVAFLVANKTELDTQDNEGDTPLLVAIHVKSDKNARKLIEEGADANLADNDGNTPLHMAVKQGTLEVAKMLLGNGAKPGVENKEGQTPLDLAKAENKEAFIELLEKQE